MEGIIKEPVMKIENNIVRSSIFPDHTTSTTYGLFDMFEDRNSLGFMELLGFHHHDFGTTSSSSSMFDDVNIPSSYMVQSSPPPNSLFTKMESSSNSEVLNNNQPVTPNSSSVSSASSEALNDDLLPPVKLLQNEEEDEEEEEEEEQQKTKKELKTKKTNQKRQREPRFAFMTKSEVDHLEDGYRWRKYGQKAVKNSPFPRSYYRCTTSSCNVKKRVERSFSDPTIVVTTYEGQHTHPSPVMPRPSFIGAGASMNSDSAFSSSSTDSYTQRRLSSLYQQHQQTQPQFINSLISPNLGAYYGNNNYNYNNNGSSAISSFDHHDQKRYCTTPPLTRSTTTATTSTPLVEDHGLLQDVVPSYMFKE